MLKQTTLRFIPLLILSATNAHAEQMQPEAPFILGYTNQLSVAPGEEISLHLSSSESQASIVIERIGAQRENGLGKEWYSGFTATNSRSSVVPRVSMAGFSSIDDSGGLDERLLPG